MGAERDNHPRTEEDSEGISRHQLFEILQNRRRRLVLKYLFEHEEEADFTDIVNYVASHENSVPPNQVTSEQKNRVRTTLYQYHLEKLENCGLITYHKNDGKLKLACERDYIGQYLDIDSPDTKAIVGYVFGTITLILGTSFFLLEIVVVEVSLIIGCLGIIQIIVLLALQRDLFQDVLR